MTITMLKVLHF